MFLTFVIYHSRESTSQEDMPACPSGDAHGVKYPLFTVGYLTSKVLVGLFLSHKYLFKIRILYFGVMSHSS